MLACLSDDVAHDINQGEREIGNIGVAAEGHAMAVVRLDRVSPDVQITLGGLPVTLKLPDWASYGFGESPTGDE